MGFWLDGLKGLHGLRAEDFKPLLTMRTVYAGRVIYYLATCGTNGCIPLTPVLGLRSYFASFCGLGLWCCTCLSHASAATVDISFYSPVSAFSSAHDSPVFFSLFPSHSSSPSSTFHLSIGTVAAKYPNKAKNKIK